MFSIPCSTFTMHNSQILVCTSLQPRMQCCPWCLQLCKEGTVHVWDVAITACCRGLSACVKSVTQDDNVVLHGILQCILDKFGQNLHAGRVSPQQ